MGEKPRASHINPESPGISDSDQSDLKLDSDAVTLKPTTYDTTNKIDSNVLPKYQSKFDAVSKCQKVSGDLCLAIFGLKIPCFWLSTPATSHSVVQLF